MSFRIALVLLSVSALFADTLTLRSGKVVTGSYLGGNSRQVRVAVGDNIQTFDVGDIASIQFESGGATSQTIQSAPAAPQQAETRSPQAPIAAPEPPAQPRERQILKPETAAVASAPVATAPAGSEIPAGTAIVIRMIDDVDSKVSSPGQTFKASVDEPVTIGGQTLIPRGADAVARLVEVKDPSKISGGGQLTLDLDSITVNGKVLNVKSESVTQAGESRTKQSAGVIGGTAALGAIIGAIAGGGKGAAIGAVSGAGAGTAVQVMTQGTRVRIPSETRLTFTLQQPVRL